MEGIREGAEEVRRLLSQPRRLHFHAFKLL